MNPQAEEGAKGNKTDMKPSYTLGFYGMRLLWFLGEFCAQERKEKHEEVAHDCPGTADERIMKVGESVSWVAPRVGRATSVYRCNGVRRGAGLR
jgi:hypothetical protein